jgi:cyclopropane fatty-acyl-phospholipid synthase-like methyltransferase
MKQWFESEDFWINYAPIMYDDNLWEEAPTVANYVTKIAGLKKGDTVLDAACGVGRISVELATLGMDVTGVDITKPVLEAAAQSAEDEGVSLTLLNQDLRTFTSSKKFDCAINLYTSFGYCDTIEEDMQILRNIAGALKQGGTFIMECTSRETAVMYFTEGEEFDRAGFKVRTEFSVEGAWEGLRSRWILTPLSTQATNHNTTNATAADKKVFDHTYTQRLYSAPDLCNKMLECGFSSAKAYGDFDLSPYDQHARTMIIVAKK